MEYQRVGNRMKIGYQSTMILGNWLKAQQEGKSEEEKQRLAEFVFQRVKGVADQYNETKPMFRGNHHALMTSIYEFMDNEIKKFFEQDTGSLKISCRKGCSYCCYQEVIISEDEAKDMVLYARSNNIAIDKDLLQLQKKETAAGKPHHLTSNPKCVFLQNNECSIYDRRPPECRKYYVATPPELCKVAGVVKTSKNVGQFVNVGVEVFTSGIHNSSPCGTMPEMLLKLL